MTGDETQRGRCTFYEALNERIKNERKVISMTIQDVVEGFRDVATASVADAVDKIAGKRGYMSHDI